MRCWLRPPALFRRLLAGMPFNRAYKPLLDRFGLTYPQYLVLLTLWQQDRMTVKTNRRRAGLDSGTLSPLLSGWKQADMSRRVRDAADERQVIVSLTDGGRELKPKPSVFCATSAVPSGLQPGGGRRNCANALHRLTQRLGQESTRKLTRGPAGKAYTASVRKFAVQGP